MSEIEVRPVVTRAVAKAQGLPKYYTGKPCKHGHIVERWTSGGGCATCYNERKAAADARYYAKHRVEIKLAVVRYQKQNPDKAKAWQARYRKDNVGKNLARNAIYRAENKDRIRVAGAAYYAARSAAHNEWMARWRDDNRARFREIQRKWAQENPEQRKAIFHNRRARERSATGTHTAADIKALKVIQSGKCAHPWCRVSLKSGYHVDHVIPLALGGSNDRRNLALLCAPCNLSKGARHPIDFAQRHGLLL